MKKHTKKNVKDCPCGSGKTYLDCCSPFISNQKMPSTPEELMRSRYTAYTLNDIDYIVHTMKSPATENFSIEAMRESAQKVTWIGLEVVKSSHDATKGIVEFLAYYLVDNKKAVLHEISEFNFENSKWHYVDGTHANKNHS